MRCTWLIAAAAAVGVSASAVAQSNVITQWNFNSPVPDANTSTGSLLPSIGVGTVRAIGFAGSPPAPPALAFRSGAADGGSTDTGGGTDNSALDVNPWPLQGTFSGTTGVEFAVSTAGRTNIIVTWDLRSSTRFSRFYRFEYSADGGTTWTPGPGGGIFENSQGGDRWYNTRLVDLSQITAVENNPNFRFRLVQIFAPVEIRQVIDGLPVTWPPNTRYFSTDQPEYDNGGRARIDMVTVREELTPTNPAAQTFAFPRGACRGSGIASLVAVVTPGTNPPSSNVTVTVDLTSIGGPASAEMLPSGGNDSRWLLNWPVPGNIVLGGKLLPVTVRDGQNRTFSSSIQVNIAECSEDSTAPVVISQIFGGGGNFGGTWDADFVELFNRSDTAVDISNWSVQYASSSGVFSAAETIGIPSGTVLQPGQYFLIQTIGTGGSFGIPLPNPDIREIPGFGIGQNDGKVALVRNRTTIAACPNPDLNPDVVDFVAYGQLTDCSDGAAPTVDLTAALGAYRKSDGCQDTNQNFNDFERRIPEPRNTGTVRNICSQRCVAECDGTAGLDINDFFCFLDRYAGNDPRADIDGVPGLDVNDFFFFLGAYATGCP